MDARILVVDDEPEIADLVEVYLKSEGCTVFKCGTGTEALAVVREQPLDLAILDVMLPDISGLTLCGEIRKEHHFPVLMLTAKADDMDKITGLTIRGGRLYDQALQSPGTHGPGEGPAAAVHPVQRAGQGRGQPGHHRLQRPGDQPGHP